MAETVNRVTEEAVLELGRETAKLLECEQKAYGECIWKDGEANLDTDYSTLACDCCRRAWDAMRERYPERCGISIECKTPDINIIFTLPTGEKVYKKIELKSSKSKSLPGSCIMKTDMNQPVIYTLRPTASPGTYRVACSQYHAGMMSSNTDLFQDRSPRPFLSFDNIESAGGDYVCKEKENWIEHAATCALHRITEGADCRKSWQDPLVKTICQKSIQNYLRSTPIEQICAYKMSLEDEDMPV